MTLCQKKIPGVAGPLTFLLAVLHCIRVTDLPNNKICSGSYLLDLFICFGFYFCFNLFLPFSTGESELLAPPLYPLFVYFS